MRESATEKRLRKIEETLMAQDSRADIVERGLLVHQTKCDEGNKDMLRRMDRQDSMLRAILFSVIGALALMAWDLVKLQLGGK